jgi:hypothetical protein
MNPFGSLGDSSKWAVRRAATTLLDQSKERLVRAALMASKKNAGSIDGIALEIARMSGEVEMADRLLQLIYDAMHGSDGKDETGGHGND